LKQPATAGEDRRTAVKQARCYLLLLAEGHEPATVRGDAEQSSPRGSLGITFRVLVLFFLLFPFQSKSLKRVALVSDLADWYSLVSRLNLLKPRLVVSPTTGIFPSDDRVIFVSLLNCTEFSTRLSEVAQTLDAISGIQVLVVCRWLGEAWLLGTVRVSGCAGV
jgi:hypothetical protein